nr:hypothetical protein [Polycyclovorans algicola]
MFVLSDQRQELLDAANLRNWWIGMPLQIGTHPEDPPELLGLNVGRLCDRMFHGLSGRASPTGANLKDFDALAVDAEGEIKFGANVRSWSALLDESTNNPLKSLGFKLAKSHISCGDGWLG